MYDIVVIGGSAGGFEPLRRLVAALPPDLPVAVFAVLHLSPSHPSVLASLLDVVSPLKAVEAKDGMPITPGFIYAAAPDHHLLLREGVLSLTRGPRENHSRPAIDPLFRSAARAYGRRVIAILLSGRLDDGALGLMAVKSYGGITIVQDPNEASYASMPNTAIQYGAVDYSLPVDQIAPCLVDVVRAPERRKGGERMTMTIEENPSSIIQQDMEEQVANERKDQLSVYTCPECGGVIWQLREGSMPKYQCHVGHSYSPDVFLMQKTEDLEEALWAAIRLLKEKALLTQQTAERIRASGNEEMAARLQEQAERDEHHLQTIRDHILLEPAGPTTQGFSLARLLRDLYPPQGKSGEKEESSAE